MGKRPELLSHMFTDIRTCFRRDMFIVVASGTYVTEPPLGNGDRSLLVGSINDFYAETVSGWGQMTTPVIKLLGQMCQ